jgi:RNA polymerase sigma-70 factor, ECF subfamily
MNDPKRPELGSDESIVQRVTAGEPALFEVLVRRNNQRLFRAARAILSNDDEAQDVMQEAYVRAFASLSTFRGEARFSTWLTRICVNEALARRRKSRTTEPLEEAKDLAMQQTTPEQDATGAELAAWLERALDAVPDAYRIVFMLRTVEDMSVAETATCLSIPEDTVKTRLFRARALLRRELLDHAESKREGIHTFLGERCHRITAMVMRRILSSA